MGRDIADTLNLLFAQLDGADKLDVTQFQEMVGKISPLSKVKIASLKGSVAKMARNFSSNSNVVEKIENYAIINLNGSSEEVLESYTKAIVKYRLWNMQRGICVDVSPVISPFTMLYTSSQDNTFHFLIQYCADTIDLGFDGKSAWFNGVIKDQCPFQFQGSTYLKHCTQLDFSGAYAEIAPENDPGDIPMGLPNLIEAFKTTLSYCGQSSADLRKALGTWVLYFGESPKFHALFRACSSSIIDDKIQTLNSAGGDLGHMVRFWGDLCQIGMKYMLKSLSGSRIPSLNEPLEEIQRLRITGINTLQDIIDNICLWTYSSPAYGPSMPHIKSLKTRSQTLFSPIDLASDQYEERIVKHFRTIMHAMLNEEEEAKEIKTGSMNEGVSEVWKRYGGHQATTVGHRAAESFVERQKMLFCASSWN